MKWRMYTDEKARTKIRVDDEESDYIDVWELIE